MDSSQWWGRVLLRYDKQIHFLMFGVVFLGLGSLLALVWGAGLVYALIHRDGKLFAEFLFGIPWIPLMPWLGWKGLKER